VNGPIASLVVTDVETSGLSHTTDHVIEVAIVVWDVATASVRESYASLLHADTNDAESINGISVAALAKAPPSSTVWRRVYAILSSIDGPAAFVAHRAEFDRGFYPPELAGKFPWLCSKTDFAWPRCPLGSSCVDMALRHGVPVVSAHRAMTDAMLTQCARRRPTSSPTRASTRGATSWRRPRVSCSTGRRRNGVGDSLAKTLRSSGSRFGK
jgi:DNA polymerase-3 subunit epsilon